MSTRRAACSCGQLALTIEGEPVRISMCHCLECQRRTGAVISNQARFRRDQIAFAGQASDWTRTAESGNAVTFHFCPTCGSTVYWGARAFPATSPSPSAISPIPASPLRPSLCGRRPATPGWRCHPTRRPGAPPSRDESRRVRAKSGPSSDHVLARFWQCLVRSRGLEPPRVAPLAPQASASTNSATTACGVDTHQDDARPRRCNS